MTGKTHLTVGTAVAIAAAHPQSLTSLCLCAAAGAVGSVLSDIDVDTSESHRGLARIMAVLGCSVLILALVEHFFHPGLATRLQAQTNLTRLVPVCIIFLVICWFGMQQPHRSFMHSLLGLIALSLTVAGMELHLTIPFAAAMASHLVLDLLNQRRVRLFYPLGKGFCLSLFSANGLINDLLFGAGCLALGVELAVYTPLRQLIL